MRRRVHRHPGLPVPGTDGAEKKRDPVTGELRADTPLSPSDAVAALDVSILTQSVTARRQLGIEWEAYCALPEGLLEAWLWECGRQQAAEVEAMYGPRGAAKTPGLNKLRQSYLEVFWQIANGLTANGEQTDVDH